MTDITDELIKNLSQYHSVYSFGNFEKAMWIFIEHAEEIDFSECKGLEIMSLIQKWMRDGCYQGLGIDLLNTAWDALMLYLSVKDVEIAKLKKQLEKEKL